MQWQITPYPNTIGSPCVYPMSTCPPASGGCDTESIGRDYNKSVFVSTVEVAAGIEMGLLRFGLSRIRALTPIYQIITDYDLDYRLDHTTGKSMHNKNVMEVNIGYENPTLLQMITFPRSTDELKRAKPQ